MTYKTHMTEEEHFEYNFRSRIDKIRNVCNTWVNRSMSLKGKITLVNSLMISVLHYPCSCTFIPPRVLFEVKKIVTDFIWDTKRPKIAYNLLIQKVENGGLNLADIETRALTSHINIIKGLWNHPNSVWASILAEALGTNDIRVTLLTKSDLSKTIPEEYSTFKQCLATWYKVRRFSPISESEVAEEIIWGNDSIIINKKHVFWQEWIAADILSINDLLHEHEPRFLSHAELATFYNVRCSFLDLYQIRTAIPCSWKRLLTNQRILDHSCKPRIKLGGSPTLDIANATSKLIYHLLLKDKALAVASQQRWAETFTDLPEEPVELADYWKEIYLSPYCTTRDTKLQAFQYKLIHRVLPCNRYLHNIRIKESDICSFCTEKDTLQHFFWTCSLVQDFWHKVEEWLSLNGDIHIQTNMKQFLFGFPKTHPQVKIINLLSLAAKHFIYRQKLFHAGNLELIHFLREFRAKLGIEKFICMKENKIRKFARWNRIYNALG